MPPTDFFEIKDSADDDEYDEEDEDDEGEQDEEQDHAEDASDDVCAHRTPHSPSSATCIRQRSRHVMRREPAVGQMATHLPHSAVLYLTAFMSP